MIRTPADEAWEKGRNNDMTVVLAIGFSVSNSDYIRYKKIFNVKHGFIRSSAAGGCFNKKNWMSYRIILGG